MSKTIENRSADVRIVPSPVFAMALSVPVSTAVQGEPARAVTAATTPLAVVLPGLILIVSTLVAESHATCAPVPVTSAEPTTLTVEPFKVVPTALARIINPLLFPP